MRIFWTVVCSIAAIATIALSAFAVYAEQSHFIAAGRSDQEAIEAFISGGRATGLSSATQRAYMLDCRNAIVSDAGRALASERQLALRQACLDGAAAVLDVNPNASFAWLSRAHAALALGDAEGVNAYLARSYQTGGNEGWIAQYRVELVEQNFSIIAEANLPHNRHDLELLVREQPLVEFLANLYVHWPGSRERITAAVEAASANEQARFLGSVRHFMLLTEHAAGATQ